MTDSKKNFFKKVVKRNQVIIAALAVMIIIAGYLNISGQSNSQKTGGSTVQSGENKGDNAANDKDGNGKEDASKEDSVSSGGNTLDVSDEDIVPPGDSDSQDQEASNNDIKDEAVSGTEGGSNVGSAILASTALGSNYFGNAKLGREQVRAQNKETLEGVINDSSIGDDAKTSAINSLIAMTEAAALEDELETLLEAKGFETVCYIDSDEVDVIVNAKEITDQDVAKIEDVVMRNTEIDATGIVITDVVTEE